MNFEKSLLRLNFPTNSVYSFNMHKFSQNRSLLTYFKQKKARMMIQTLLKPVCFDSFCVQNNNFSTFRYILFLKRTEVWYCENVCFKLFLKRGARKILVYQKHGSRYSWMQKLRLLYSFYIKKWKNPDLKCRLSDVNIYKKDL